MSEKQNKTIAHQLIEDVMNQGILSLSEQFLSTDFVEHEELPPGTPTGIEGFNHLVAELHSAFPDFKATIHEMIAEDDKVAVYMNWSGTQQGAFMGMPPSGNRISISVFDIFRMADGKIAEHWGLTDSMAMMQQLGTMPPSE